jgi:hypothetical protein
MRKILIPVAALALLLPLGAARAAAPADPEASGITLSGEIVDMACYLGHGGKGPQHAACALKCAQAGQPVGLLTDDGKLYLLLGDHADTSAFDKAKSLAGQKVQIHGETADRNGVEGLVVESVSKA